MTTQKLSFSLTPFLKIMMEKFTKKRHPGKKLFLILFSIGSFLWLLSNTQESGKKLSPLIIRGSTMGTYFIVTYFPNQGKKIKIENLNEMITKDLEKVNQQMSTYIDDSEISQFNRIEKNKDFRISPWFYEVTKFSLELSNKTSGSFDPTVGPLVNKWGFGPKKNQLPPTAQEIQKTLSQVGYEKIKLTEKTIKKSHSKVYLDLSSVAKGFAVDIISEKLNSLGISNHLVEIGGEIRASGDKNGSPWLIGIEDPNLTENLQQLVFLKNSSIATSGPYRNYFETENGKITHTIDPKTGKALINNILSVSIIDKKCMKADALATALLVMGENKAIQYTKDNQIAAMLIIENGTNKKTFMTEKFKQAIFRG
ncbi:MAG: hypothetical protein CMP11_02935 [Zetaproteobacteria bacterium]|nr:hypothetical protein [Pseudobdellovibrionaceae bacterium]|tara:strand:+ start:697 stop:1800 length:1104 start_codon:yes stop_codon:yes gene_type:complete